ncbi:hypothetical protein K504DRAFT_447823 [Pleomassaria siparia CBS 279.74]|uniref:Uncharacterized protein n=1 Tax=Pleomassaria siparia CBS 279.74 TaxID=1314801 RepID=A0A6G1K260_9PLEO|nr:hypothetical protein K504DRAFT_447823 [Pleomassaria siparia CBS 279.74]
MSPTPPHTSNGTHCLRRLIDSFVSLLLHTLSIDFSFSISASSDTHTHTYTHEHIQRDQVPQKTGYFPRCTETPEKLDRPSKMGNTHAQSQPEMWFSAGSLFTDDSVSRYIIDNSITEDRYLDTFGTFKSGQRTIEPSAMLAMCASAWGTWSADKKKCKLNTGDMISPEVINTETGLFLRRDIPSTKPREVTEGPLVPRHFVYTLESLCRETSRRIGTVFRNGRCYIDHRSIGIRSYAGVTRHFGTYTAGYRSHGRYWMDTDAMVKICTANKGVSNAQRSECTIMVPAFGKSVFDFCRSHLNSTWRFKDSFYRIPVRAIDGEVYRHPNGSYYHGIPACTVGLASMIKSRTMVPGDLERGQDGVYEIPTTSATTCSEHGKRSESWQYHVQWML